MEIFRRKVPASQVVDSTMKKCPHCAEQILKEAKICKHCGKNQPSKVTRVAGFVVLGFFFFIFLMIMIGSGSSNSTSPSTPPVSSVKIGDTAYLSTPGMSVVLLGTTKENEDELIRLAVAKDELGMAKMVQDGTALMVDKNTQVRVIDSSIGSKQVRILEGKYYGESGWLPSEFVVPNQR